MSGQLYKVRLAYPYDDAADGPESTIGKMLAWSVNRLEANRARRKVLSWLNEEDRKEHLRNIYDNGREGLTIVLADRDTALLLKLALG
jgi:hypothetical protein